MNDPRMTVLTLLSSLLVVACGPDPDAFADAFPEAMCDWTAECAWEQVDADGELPPAVNDRADGVCTDEMAELLDLAASDPACTYDPGQARQCLSALQGPCEERTAVYYECKRVYSGDDCEVELTGSM